MVVGKLLRRVAVIVSRGDPDVIMAMAAACRAAAGEGGTVRLFFRDESIPAICTAPVAAQLTGSAAQPELAGALEDLVQAGDIRLYACSSSLYLWGVGPNDLLPAIAGSRGLVAFLADDLAEADEVLTY